MIHLRVADQLLQRLPGLDDTCFVMGNIAPDSGVPDADGVSFHPPKRVSHYQEKRDGKTVFEIQRFTDRFLTPDRCLRYTLKELSFYAGYWAHLLTDVLWIRDVLRPAIRRFPQDYARDKLGFIICCKRDWYDLDFLYLQQHPDFAAFRICEENAAGFRNDYLDYFSPTAFDERRQFICGFYRSPHGKLERDYPYLTKEEADAFVARATDAIEAQFRERHFEDAIQK